MRTTSSEWACAHVHTSSARGRVDLCVFCFWSQKVLPLSVFLCAEMSSFSYNGAFCSTCIWRLRVRCLDAERRVVGYNFCSAPYSQISSLHMHVLHTKKAGIVRWFSFYKRQLLPIAIYCVSLLKRTSLISRWMYRHSNDLGFNINKCFPYTSHPFRLGDITLEVVIRSTSILVF